MFQRNRKKPHLCPNGAARSVRAVSVWTAALMAPTLWVCLRLRSSAEKDLSNLRLPPPSPAPITSSPQTCSRDARRKPPQLPLHESACVSPRLYSKLPNFQQNRDGIFKQRQKLWKSRKNREKGGTGCNKTSVYISLNKLLKHPRLLPYPYQSGVGIFTGSRSGYRSAESRQAGPHCVLTQAALITWRPTRITPVAVGLIIILWHTIC